MHRVSDASRPGSTRAEPSRRGCVRRGAGQGAKKVSPSFVRRHVASLAVYILARGPALLEKAAAFTGATKLLAVPDVLGPLLPLVPVSTRGFESRFALLRLPTLPLLRFGSLLRYVDVTGTGVSHPSFYLRLRF